MPDVLAPDDPFSVGPGSVMASAPDAGAPAPVPPTPGEQVQQRYQRNLDRQDQMIDRLQQSSDRQDQIAEDRTKALAPLRQKQMEMASQKLPSPPQQKQPPAVPQRNSRSDDEDWLQAAMLLGALAGGFTRRHMTNALGAMQGAIEGYQEGSRQKFDQNMKIWDAENKKTIEANKAAMDHYTEVIQNRKLNLDQMSMELQIAAATYDDKAMAEAAKSKNTLVIAQLIDKQDQSLEQFTKAAQGLATSHAEAKQREWDTAAQQAIQSPGMQARIAAIIRGEAPLPPNARTGYEGAINRAITERVYALSPGFDAATFGGHQVESKTGPMVERQKALNPIRAEGAGLTSAARTAGVAGTNIELASRSAGPIIEMASAASQGVPRTEFTHLNKLFQMADSEINDPALQRFKLVNEELATMFARVLNPRSSVITVSGIEHARNLISTATSPEAYAVMLQQIKQLTEREFRVVKEQQHGDPIAPINVAPGAQGSSAGDVLGQIGRRGAAAQEQSIPGSVGRREPSGVRIGASPPAPPALTQQQPPTSPSMPLPPGWTLTPVP